MLFDKPSNPFYIHAFIFECFCLSGLVWSVAAVRYDHHDPFIIIPEKRTGNWIILLEEKDETNERSGHSLLIMITKFLQINNV